MDVPLKSLVTELVAVFIAAKWTLVANGLTEVPSVPAARLIAVAV